MSPTGVVVLFTPHERDIVRNGIAHKLAPLAETHATLATRDELSAQRIIREHRDCSACSMTSAGRGLDGTTEPLSSQLRSRRSREPDRTWHPNSLVEQAITAILTEARRGSRRR